MSMDEMLLNELYGSEEVAQEEQIKQAQVELVEAVAAEAGVDLNELDDEELAKFAHYVLTDEDEAEANLYQDHEADPHQQKLAEADLMGRQMAHSYVDELNTIGDNMSYYEDSQIKVASAMEDVAEAWAMEKLAETPDAPDAPDAPEAPKRTMRDRAGDVGRFVQRQAGFGPDLGEMSDAQKYLRRTGAGALGASAIYGGYRGVKALKNRKKQEKKASISDMIAWELEKIASNKDGETAESMMDRMKDRASRAGRFVQHHAGFGPDMADEAKKTERYLRRTGAGALGAGAIYGGYRGVKALKNRKKNQEKKASLFLDAGYEALAAIELCEPEEFAKEAEFRAAEILAANGVHPETFEDIQPEEIKIASFPGVEYAADEYEAAALEEYNEMLDTAAMHIIENLLDD